MHFGAKIKDSVGNAPSLSYHIQEFTMVVLRLRLSFAVDMPYLNPHWWQQEMLDASCSLDLSCSCSHTRSLTHYAAVDQEISKKQYDICDTSRILRSHHK